MSTAADALGVKSADRSKRRYLRFALISCGIALVIVLGAVAILLARVEPSDYAALLNTRVQQLTGRSLSIGGKVRLSISLVPTVSVEDVRFANATWGSRPHMLQARRIEVVVALLPLLRGEVEIRAIEIVEPDLFLETSAAGDPNWIFETADTAAKRPAQEKSERTIGVHRVRVVDGVVTYRDGATMKDRRLEINALTVARDGEAFKISSDARMDTVPLELLGTARRASASATAPLDIDMKLMIPGITLTAKGAVPIGPHPDAQRTLELRTEIKDWASVAKLAHIADLKLPPLTAATQLHVQADAFDLRNLTVTLGKSKAAGSMRIARMTQVPVIAASVDAPILDLAELLGPPVQRPRTDNRVFSDEPFDAAVLKAVNGKVDARIARLVMRDGKTFDGVSLAASLDRGKLKADPIRLRVEGRELRIRADADASSANSLALDLSVQGSSIPLAALASLLNASGAAVDGAPTDVNVRLSGRGRSLRALIAESGGEVRIVVGPGRVRSQSLDFGADITELLNVLNPARKTDSYTELKCAVVRLPIQRGIVRVDNTIAVETSKVHMIAAGIIDLRNETLDLGFRPKAVTGMGIGLGGLASLARLRGSLSDPSVEADLGGAAAQLGLAAITGGLSLIAGGMLPASVPEQPCQAALAGNMRTQPMPKAAEPSVLDDMMGGIKRIFQR